MGQADLEPLNLDTGDLLGWRTQGGGGAVLGSGGGLEVSLVSTLQIPAVSPCYDNHRVPRHCPISPPGGGAHNRELIYGDRAGIVVMLGTQSVRGVGWGAPDLEKVQRALWGLQMPWVVVTQVNTSFRLHTWVKVCEADTYDLGILLCKKYS